MKIRLWACENVCSYRKKHDYGDAAAMPSQYFFRLSSFNKKTSWSQVTLFLKGWNPDRAVQIRARADPGWLGRIIFLGNPGAQMGTREVTSYLVSLSTAISVPFALVQSLGKQVVSLQVRFAPGRFAPCNSKSVRPNPKTFRLSWFLFWSCPNDK